MRLRLEPPALLWWLDGDSTLSAAATKAISDGANVVIVSAASAWEMAIKRTLGKLSCPDDLEGAVAACGFQSMPISTAHALAAGALPRHHDDPFDRMLIAQASAVGLTPVSRDERFQPYGVAVLTA